MGSEWELEWVGAWGTGFHGRAAVAMAAELAPLLQLRDANGDAEFTLSRSGSAHPYLLLSVHLDRWYAHFFPAEEEPGAFIVDDESATGEWLRLPAGSDILVDGSSLIDGTLALHLAGEFISTGQRPPSGRWSEL